MSTLLEIKDLKGGYEQDVNILQGIDLMVAEGEAVGIIGLNGSGKSTLGKAVMNLLPYRSGKIFYEGQDVTQCSTHELAQLGMAMMHQGGVVFPNLSVWQNLQMAMGNGETQNFASLQSIIPLLQQPKKKLMRTMADKLSGGQRHELALAMTLARKPKLVILDEPSAGLSPKAVEEMYGMLEKINNMTFILIEQNVNYSVSFCERCVMLGMGRIEHSFSNDEKRLKKIESIMFKI